MIVDNIRGGEMKLMWWCIGTSRTLTLKIFTNWKIQS